MATFNLRDAFGASEERIREAMEEERKGLVQYTTPDMADEEKRLHWKYKLPPSVDLSAEALAKAKADRERRQAAQIAQSTLVWEEWVRSTTGVVPRQPEEIFKATPAEVTKRARKICDDIEAGALGYFLSGCQGSGKSSTADLILHYWTCDGWGGERVTEKQFVEAMRACVDGASRREEVFARYSEPGLLVIEDMGVTKPTEWALAELTDLLDSRMEKGLRLVITSNLTASGLQERWAQADPNAADRLASRLKMLLNFTLPNVDHRSRVTVRSADEMM